MNYTDIFLLFAPLVVGIGIGYGIGWYNGVRFTAFRMVEDLVLMLKRYGMSNEDATNFLNAYKKQLHESKTSNDN